MKICFVDTAPPDRPYFEQELAGHDLLFCERLQEVPPRSQVLSTFIDSNIDEPFLREHPGLRLIATRSTTYDHIDLEACARRDIAVRGVLSYGDHTVSEHTFALILTLTRRMREAMASNNGHIFSYDALRSTELWGKTLGVVGAGRIGRQTLRMAAAFGMKTIAYDIKPVAAAAAQIGFEYVTFHGLLRRSDVISLNVPLTPATFHFFDRNSFARCRPGVLIINTARGGLIETEALIEALDTGIAGGAGLDVIEDERVMRKNASQIIRDQIIDRLSESFAPAEPLVQSPERAHELRRLMQNNQLLSHPRVVFTPHIAFNSFEAIDRINRTTVGHIRAFYAERPGASTSKKKGRPARVPAIKH